MASNFNDAAVQAVFAKIVSFAQATGRFEQVNQHEPKNKPGHGVLCSVWIQRIRPIPESGLAATSGVLILNVRIYKNMLELELDSIDPEMTSAALDMMAAITGDFLLTGVPSVRNVDLIGSTGTALDSQAGYVELGRGVFRVITITVPVIINDLFTQVA